MTEKHYYKFISYIDHSGRCEGLRIFKLTEEEVERRRVRAGEIYERIPDHQENKEENQCG